MRELSLFTGAGGGCLGSRMLGWKVVAYVEFDRPCTRMIRARIRDGTFDRAPIFHDIREFDGTAWEGSVDVLTGGFPCQPFSSSGRRAGPDDPRNMWPDTLRVLRECRSPWALFENVRGLLSSGYFGEILHGLDGAGYSVWWTVLSAGDMGAPHRRDRLWMVARSDSRPETEPSRRAEEGWGRICLEASRSSPFAETIGFPEWKLHGMMLDMGYDIRWPDHGVISGGMAWKLTPIGTCPVGSGSISQWPIPGVVSNVLDSSDARDVTNNGMLTTDRAGRQLGASLATTIRSRYMTPKSASIRFGRDQAIRFVAENRQVSLEEQVKMEVEGAWPTPSASVIRTSVGHWEDRRDMFMGKGVNLQRSLFVETLRKFQDSNIPTPTSSQAGKSHRTLDMVESGESQMTLDRWASIQARSNGDDWRDLILNPEWVEWLMGWPIGHTSTRPNAERTLEWDRAISCGSWWSTEPEGMPRLTRLDGTAAQKSAITARLKAIGNGQVPSCVMAVWKALEGRHRMADRFGNAVRSRIMRSIPGKGTGPEEALSLAMSGVGIPHRRNVKALPGTPDMVIPGKVAVFVDGCFWHGCPKHYRKPSSNMRFWSSKLRVNRERDSRVDIELGMMGYLVVRLWECDIRDDMEKCLERVSCLSMERKAKT